MSELSKKAQEKALELLVTSSVCNAIGNLTDKLQDDLSCQVEDRLQSVEKVGAEHSPSSNDRYVHPSLLGSLPGVYRLVGHSLLFGVGCPLEELAPSLRLGMVHSLSGLNTIP